MGIKPKLKNRQKKTSLRSVVYMVVAGLRMKKMQVEWSVNKKLRATLAKKAAASSAQSRRSIGH
jgi:hypothetical protein